MVSELFLSLKKYLIPFTIRRREHINGHHSELHQNVGEVVGFGDFQRYRCTTAISE